jgi:hypothetical protein
MAQRGRAFDDENSVQAERFPATYDTTGFPAQQAEGLTFLDMRSPDRHPSLIADMRLRRITSHRVNAPAGPHEHGRHHNSNRRALQVAAAASIGSGEWH